jgi:hypothetical protein
MPVFHETRQQPVFMATGAKFFFEKFVYDNGYNSYSDINMTLQIQSSHEVFMIVKQVRIFFRFLISFPFRHDSFHIFHIL